MGQSHAKKENETRLLSRTIPKNQLKWNKDLNVRLETIKLLEENRGSLLFEISLCNYFLLMSPQAKEAKEKLSKWVYIKRKNICTAKEIINKTKRLPTEWEIVFSNKNLIRGSDPKYKKSLYNSTLKKKDS